MSTWNFKTLLTQEHVFLDAFADHGTIIVAYFSYAAQANLLRSTDGGSTWTSVFTGGSGGNPGCIRYAGLISGNKTWYYLGHNTAQSHVSTDDGQTWSTLTDALTASVSAGASDVNGTVIAASGAHVEATVNASALAAFATPTGWVSTLTASILWDGTHFVAIETDSGPTNYGVWTAPSGFTIGAGPSWTQAGTGTTNKWVPASQGGMFAYVPGIGYAALVQAATPKYVIASTPAGLVTATQIDPNLDSAATVQGFAGAGSFLFWTDGVAGTGKVYHSADGTTWISDTLSQSFQTNERGAYVVYDSVHNTYVLLGSLSSSTGSSIYTLFVPPPFSISPTNPNCNFGTSIYFTEVGDDGSGVVWSVNGIVGGNSAVGTISPYGVYTAPTQATVIANGGPTAVTVSAANRDGGGSPSSVSTTVTFTLPLIKAFGAFRGQKVFRPVSLVNVGLITPKIYAPGENTTIKSQS